MFQAGVVFVGLQLGFGIRNFATVLTFFCLLWIVMAISIYREHKRISEEA